MAFVLKLESILQICPPPFLPHPQSGNGGAGPEEAKHMPPWDRSAPASVLSRGRGRRLPGRTRTAESLNAVNPAFNFVLFPSDNSSNFPAAHHLAWDLSGSFMDPSE